VTDVFISYARSTVKQPQAIAEALRSLGYGVWLDDELPAHRAFADVLEERLKAARAVLVIWSAGAVRSQWVQSEADRAREEGKLVQLSLDDTRLPMPFDRIQCANLQGWTGDLDAPGWRKVVASIAELIGGVGALAAPVPVEPLPLPSKPSIAVMPFANLSGDPEQEYFADGMVEEIVGALSRFKSIFVISSGSTLSFKGKAVSPIEAGRRLGVRYVLEGSVRAAAGRVRIAVKLTDTRDGAQIWADRFEDTLADVFALQDKVALSTAAKIEPTVQLAEFRRAAARPTENMNSYDLYLRAQPRFYTYGRIGIAEALELAERAMALDPEFGLAIARAAHCHFVIGRNGWSDDPENHRLQAIELAHRAVRVAGDDAVIIAGAALVVAEGDRDYPAAVALFDRAIALNPGAAGVWSASGAARVRAGDIDLGIEHLEVSIRLDPLGPARFTQMANMALGRFLQGRFAEAVALAREFNQQTEGALSGNAVLAASYGHLGQSRAAREALGRFRDATPLPIDAFGKLTIHDPAGQKLFEDGIRLAREDVAASASPAAPDSR
jgi:adenylate cyclase